ncbi:hypothetical protein C8F01DRAFT_1079378 [Mycena amicta]|nr:hypothetical protein C8F01DRAFT_1079378 [Mycena amicta]
MDNYEHFRYCEHPSTQPMEDARCVPVKYGGVGGSGYSNVEIGRSSAVHIPHPTVAPRSTSFGSHLVPHPSNGLRPRSASSPVPDHRHDQTSSAGISDSAVDDEDAQDVPMIYLQAVPQRPRITMPVTQAEGLPSWDHSATDASSGPSSPSLQVSPCWVKLLTGESAFLPEVYEKDSSNPFLHILDSEPRRRTSARRQDTVRPPPAHDQDYGLATSFGGLSLDLATFPTSDSFQFASPAETLLPAEDLSIKDNPFPLSHFGEAFMDARVQDMLRSIVDTLALHSHSSSETRSTQSFSTHSLVPSDQSDYGFHTAESSRGDAHSLAPFSPFFPAPSPHITSMRGPRNKSTSRRRALSPYARTAASTSQSDGNAWAGEQVVIPPAASSSSSQFQWMANSAQPTTSQAIAGARTIVGSAAGRTAARTRRKEPNKRGAYICKFKFCKADFTAKHNLKFHYKSHNGQKDWICSKCDQGFVTPHVRNRHQEKCLSSNGTGNDQSPA